MRGVLKVERGTGCGKGYQEQDVKPGWQRWTEWKGWQGWLGSPVPRVKSGQGDKGCPDGHSGEESHSGEGG